VTDSCHREEAEGRRGDLNINILRGGGGGLMSIANFVREARQAALLLNNELEI
jgi:hypothetical protein